MSLPVALEEQPRRLPAGITVGDVAHAARRALFAFLELAQRPCEEATVLAWLNGPYRTVLGLARRSTLPPPSGRSETNVTLSLANNAEPLATTVVNAKAGVERVLAAFLRDPDLSIASDMTARGIVERVQDESGDVGYAPIATNELSLAVRVLTVAVADMLTCPELLRSALEGEDGAKGRGDKRSVSAVVPRTRAPDTSPYFGEPGKASTPPTLEDLVREAILGS